MTGDLDGLPLGSLLVLAGAPPADVAGGIADLHPERLADLLVGEIAWRCLPLPRLPEVPVQLDVTAGSDDVHPYTLSVSEEGVTAARGTSADAPLKFGYDLVDLVRLVYGPAGNRAGHTRRAELRLGRECPPDAPDPKKWLGRMDSVARAGQVVLAALDQEPPRLDELAVRYGSDKFGGLHWFTPHYQRHFAALRHEPLRVLEIGIGGYEKPHLGGGSLRTWKRYFRRALVVGIDIFDKSGIDEPRIATVRGDQSDPDFLRGVAERHGPFDVVVDDGSHLSAHVVSSFRALWPALRPGGQYVVEDLQYSYSPGWGGDGSDLDSPHTSMGFLKTLADDLHHETWPDDAPRPPSELAAEIGAVHFYRGIAFVEKSVNVEGPLPPWIPKSGLPPR
jgi:demethylmacrocin O-methyltransferase